MKVSVVIPTYNSATVIQATLDSVLQQTVSPDEILILDDGSTDKTVHILESYKPRVTVFQQTNRGVAHARNVLCGRARGDLIAFLDHDDIWHPGYLELQHKLAENYPDAVALFTGHVDFHGYGNYQWNNNPFDFQCSVERIDCLSFLKRYNKAPGPFASMSYCCIPKVVLREIGSDPFAVSVSGADDFYLFNVLPILGPIVYAPVPLVAYRITGEAHSANRLKSVGLAVNSFELIEERYRNLPKVELVRAFGMAYASKRRHYGKILMGVGNTSEARRQFRYSLSNTRNPLSIAKSLGLLILSLMPTPLHPKWVSSNREWNESLSESNEDERSTAQPFDS
ncbi:MAG: glycosyltransferase family 2 protein [Desulfobacteraceae bacterium]|nr:glycosyltransferase family 2 protein [Desulfobacteraceae bacterium]